MSLLWDLMGEEWRITYMTAGVTALRPNGWEHQDSMKITCMTLGVTALRPDGWGHEDSMRITYMTVGVTALDPMGQYIMDDMRITYMTVSVTALEPNGWGHEGQYEDYLHGCGCHCSGTQWVRTWGTIWGLLTWLWVSLPWDPMGEDMRDNMRITYMAVGVTALRPDGWGHEGQHDVFHCCGI